MFDFFGEMSDFASSVFDSTVNTVDTIENQTIVPMVSTADQVAVTHTGDGASFITEIFGKGGW